MPTDISKYLPIEVLSTLRYTAILDRKGGVEKLFVDKEPVSPTPAHKALIYEVLANDTMSPLDVYQVSFWVREGQILWDSSRSICGNLLRPSA